MSNKNNIYISDKILSKNIVYIRYGDRSLKTLKHINKTFKHCAKRCFIFCICSHQNMRYQVIAYYTLYRDFLYM